MNPCTHCGGPHAHWRCPKQPAYSETGAMIELGQLDYERFKAGQKRDEDFEEPLFVTLTDIQGEDFTLI